MRSKIVIQKPTATSIGLIGLDSLLDVYDNTQAGDLVIVYPGTYDIGNNSIQLKDGVNWKFMPGVTISSDSTDGTFKDNGVAVNIKIDGIPYIINTNNGGMINLSGASIIKGLIAKIKLMVSEMLPEEAYFYIASTNIDSSMLLPIVVTRQSAGVFRFSFANKLFGGTLVTQGKQYFVRDGNGFSLKAQAVFGETGQYFDLRFMKMDGTMTDPYINDVALFDLELILTGEAPVSTFSWSL